MSKPDNQNEREQVSCTLCDEVHEAPDREQVYLIAREHTVEEHAQEIARNHWTEAIEPLPLPDDESESENGEQNQTGVATDAR